MQTAAVTLDATTRKTSADHGRFYTRKPRGKAHVLSERERRRERKSRESPGRAADQHWLRIAECRPRSLAAAAAAGPVQPPRGADRDDGQAATPNGKRRHCENTISSRLVAPSIFCCIFHFSSIIKICVNANDNNIITYTFIYNMAFDTNIRVQRLTVLINWRRRIPSANIRISDLRLYPKHYTYFIGRYNNNVIFIIIIFFFFFVTPRRSFSQSIRYYDFETFIMLLSYSTFTKTFNLWYFFYHGEFLVFFVYDNP